jgi:hypothetical protein
MIREIPRAVMYVLFTIAFAAATFPACRLWLFGFDPTVYDLLLLVVSALSGERVLPARYRSRWPSLSFRAAPAHRGRRRARTCGPPEQ